VQTVQVDDALLGFCNEAYERASRRGIGEVGIADLAWCIAGSSRWTREIELAGGSAARLLAASEAALAAAQRDGISGAPGAPRTADELKTVLARAERIADQLGRACATPGDLIHVLLLEAHDLRSAAFVRSSIGQPTDFPSEGRPADRCIHADARAGSWSRHDRATGMGDAQEKW